jgi:hypothetical protein
MKYFKISCRRAFQAKTILLLTIGVKHPFLKMVQEEKVVKSGEW